MTASMDGKTVVVTGANCGIGLETAAALAEAGARVVMTSRDPERGAVALGQVKARTGNGNVELVLLDLADFASVRSAAQQIVERYAPIDVLVNNAGAVLSERKLTVDGNERTFQVNHLGPFLLTKLLEDSIKAAPAGRIVVVSSDAHRGAKKGLDFDNLQGEKKYSSFRAYGASKLENILFTRELARRLTDTGVTANALHPGFVATRFGRDGDIGAMSVLIAPMSKLIAISPEKGAATSVFLASDASIDGVTGGYWYKCAPKAPVPAAEDDDAARRLWTVSEELTGKAA